MSTVSQRVYFFNEVYTKTFVDTHREVGQRILYLASLCASTKKLQIAVIFSNFLLNVSNIEYARKPAGFITDEAHRASSHISDESI